MLKISSALYVILYIRAEILFLSKKDKNVITETTGATGKIKLCYHYAKTFNECLIGAATDAISHGK